MAEEKQPQPVAAQAPQEEADLQERIDGFNKELQPLLGKFELGLAALQQVTPDGRIMATPIVVSVRGQVKTPVAPAPTTAPAPDAGLSKAE